MRLSATSIITAVAIGALTSASEAATQTATGVVTQVFSGFSPPETVAFSISTALPTGTGCRTSGFFSFTTADIPDAQSRKNMYSLLLTAASSGASVTVSYDDTGAHCAANGYPVPLMIGMSP